MNLTFIEDFYYNEEYNEWRFDVSDGYFTLWKELKSETLWVLSKVDSEDYIHQICIGYEHEIINSFKSQIRDSKLNYLLCVFDNIDIEKTM